MPKDINGIKLKTKDIVTFVCYNFTGSALHTEMKEGIIYRIDESGRIRVKDVERIKHYIHTNNFITLIERRKREVLIEKI